MVRRRFIKRSKDDDVDTEFNENLIDEESENESSEEFENEEPYDDESRGENGDENGNGRRNGKQQDNGDIKEESRSRRTRSKVNYNVDELLHVADVEGLESDDEDEVIRKPRSKIYEDDDFSDSNVAKNVDADDDFLSDESYYSRKRTRSRQRSFKKNFVINDEEGIDNSYSESETNGQSKRPKTISDELKDLVSDDNPVNFHQSDLDSPKRHLRNRNKTINYKLPPPDLSEMQLDDPSLDNNGYSDNMEKLSKSGGRYGGRSSGPAYSNIRRLYPIAGPFGGNNVQSLFNSNLASNNLSALANANDSSDSDDNTLIKSTDPNNLNSTTTTTTKKLLADVDPLANDKNISFDNVGGLDNYINQLKEMITLPLLYPEIYLKFNILPPRGVLFHGPPGTGKTLMARALASSCNINNTDKKITFFMRKGADCLSKWVGEAEKNLRLLFDEAKKNQPSIIFFDEIDGLAPVRSSKQEQIHASIVSTLLALMDGLDNRGQVIIIGATNRPDSIDPALRRPGRFDREFFFPLPNTKSRYEILKINLSKWDEKIKPNDEFIRTLADLTNGYCGADLKNLCTETILNSIKRIYPEIYEHNDKLKINIDKIKPNSNDFILALNKIIPNSAKSSSTSLSQTLPFNINYLIDNQLSLILSEIDKVLPINEQKLSILEDAKFENLNNNDFKVQSIINNLNNNRIFKPKFFLNSENDQGLKYFSNKVLNKLSNNFTIFTLDLNKIFIDSSISIEHSIINLFNELKSQSPSILYLPNLIEFLLSISNSTKLLIKYLFKNLKTTSKILLFGEIIGDLKDVEEDLVDLFDFNKKELFKIANPTVEERKAYFKFFWDTIKLIPNDYNDLRMRPKKKERKFKIVSATSHVSNNSKDLITDKKQAKQDMILKNSLKIRLANVLEPFKTRYKKFRKPIIDDHLLVHLFDEDADKEQSEYFIKDNKIFEKSTNKLYYNMDLDIIEERLWNGFYNDPKDFLNDLKLILIDCKTHGDKDKILKSNEMYSTAIVLIDEIELQFPNLAIQWKELSKREKERAKLFNKKESDKEANELINATVEVGNDGVDREQLQIQATNIVNSMSLDNLINKEQPSIEPVDVGRVNMEAITTVEAVKGSGQTDTTEKTVETVENENLEDDAKEKEVTQESDDESDEGFLPQKQTLLLNSEKIENLKELLLSKTEEHPLEQLEEINSKLSNLVWHYRLSTDKSELISAIELFINNL